MSASPAEPARRRRSTGIVLLWIGAALTGPALLVHALDAWFVPERMPPEALLPLLIPQLVMQFAWWAVGIVILTGLLLLVRTPRPLPALVFGIVLVAGWIVTVLAFRSDGTLSFPWA